MDPGAFENSRSGCVQKGDAPGPPTRPQTRADPAPATPAPQENTPAGAGPTAPQALGARCAQCDYDLSGLDWSRGILRCPECGAANVLWAPERVFKPWPPARTLYAVMLAPLLFMLAVHTGVRVWAPMFSLVSGFWATVAAFAWPFFYANLAVAVREPPERARRRVTALSMQGVGINVVTASIWLVIAGRLGA